MEEKIHRRLQKKGPREPEHTIGRDLTENLSDGRTSVFATKSSFRARLLFDDGEDVHSLFCCAAIYLCSNPVSNFAKSEFFLVVII